MIKITAFGEKHDHSDEVKQPATASSNTLRLPQMSDNIPQKCELSTTPKKAAPVNKPLATCDNDKSHSADVIMYDITNVSMITPIIQKPHTNRRSIWKMPLPDKDINKFFITWFYMNSLIY